MTRTNRSSETQLQKTRPCKFYEKGICTKGMQCGFAHGMTEIQRCPNLRKTQLCMAFQRNGSCRDGESCKYAHGVAELRVETENLHPPSESFENVDAQALPRALPPGKLPDTIPQNITVSGANLAGGQHAFVPYSTPPNMQDSFLLYPMPTMMQVAVPVTAVHILQNQQNQYASFAVTKTDDDGSSRRSTDDGQDVESTSNFSRQISDFTEISWESDDGLHCGESTGSYAVHDICNVSQSRPTSYKREQTVSMARDGAPKTPNVVMLSKTKLCKFNLQGICNKEHNCNFAHGSDELNPRPELFRTRLCLPFHRHGFCKDGKSCRFAHNEAQLRLPKKFTEEKQPQEEAVLPVYEIAASTEVAATLPPSEDIASKTVKLPLPSIAGHFPSELPVKGTFVHFEESGYKRRGSQNRSKSK